MKMPMQEKIAELERRLLTLEQIENARKRVAERAKAQAAPVDLESERSSLWRQFDALMRKALK